MNKWREMEAETCSREWGKRIGESESRVEGKIEFERSIGYGTIFRERKKRGEGERLAVQMVPILQ